jgi:hypothetical protein
MSASWTSEVRARCRERCAQVGDPPCWELGTGDEPCHPCATGEPGPELAAKAARASFQEDHSPTARRRGREGRSIPHSYGAEGRNWAGD